MPGIDVIFFDVDGTLVDSRSDIVRAVNYTLKHYAIADKTAEEIVSYIGTGVKDLLRKSLGPDKAKLTDEAVRIFSDYFLKHPTDESTLYPNVKEVLQYFSKKRKFILTNRYREFADAALKNLGIRDYFEEILGGDDESCIKPSACVIEKVFNAFHVDREKSMIVGDMAVDVMAGKNSGIRTCWVTYGLDKLDDLKGIKPDYIIDDLIELKNIIN